MALFCYNSGMGVFSLFKKKLPIEIEPREIPPPPENEQALFVVWNESRTKFCEVFNHENIDAFVYKCTRLDYDDIGMTGYYWIDELTPYASFFDTPEKAKIEAENYLKDM